MILILLLIFSFFKKKFVQLIKANKSKTIHTLTALYSFLPCIESQQNIFDLRQDIYLKISFFLAHLVAEMIDSWL